MKPISPGSEPATLDGTVTSSDRLATPPVWKLRLVYAAGTGICKVPAAVPVVMAGQQPLQIGRRGQAPDSDAWLSVQDDRVSRQHARLYLRGTQLFVEDLQSRNGSARNGVRLKDGVPEPLQDGDVLRVGDSFFVIRHEADRILDAPVAAYIGVSRDACQVRCAIARCALHPRSVLILGETGTGKEVTAQALHQLSRRPGRLVAVNCAAIPSSLAEAQLFGVARGAFTGALESPGAFADADGGTLFLDELGELPLELQPKLLRALETGEVLAVGGRQPLRRDVRIIAATNRDLIEALQKKTFREDLYARLSAEIIRLPPLRERREDILLLAQKFAGEKFRPSPRLVSALLLHPFPLNAREVGHLVARLADRSEDEVIVALATKGAARPPQDAAVAASSSASSTTSGRPALPVPVPRWKSGDPVPSAEQVTALLQKHRGNLSHIEAHSGYSRRQFRRWVDDYGLDPMAFRSGAPD